MSCHEDIVLLNGPQILGLMGGTTYSVCQHLFSLGVSCGSGLMAEVAGVWLNPQKAYLYALDN